MSVGVVGPGIRLNLTRNRAESTVSLAAQVALKIGLRKFKFVFVSLTLSDYRKLL